MWQDAKEIITRRMRAIAGSFTFPPLFVSSQTKRAYYMLKKRLQIVCEDTNEGLRFSKLRACLNGSWGHEPFGVANIQQGLKLEHYSSDTDFMDKH